MRFLPRGHRAQAVSDTTHRYGSLPDGSRNTIHATTELSIEVDDLGRPTAVWFRCLNLPFHVWHRGTGRAEHINPEGMKILNIEYETEVID